MYKAFISSTSFMYVLEYNDAIILVYVYTI